MAGTSSWGHVVLRWGLYPGASFLCASQAVQWLAICLPVQETQETRKWQPTPIFLSGKSHGQRSLVGLSRQGHKESDLTEWLSVGSLYKPGTQDGSGISRKD